MLKYGWFSFLCSRAGTRASTGALLVCLSLAVGCGEDGDSDSTKDELAAQVDDLEHPGKKPGGKQDDQAEPPPPPAAQDAGARPIEDPCALVDCRDGHRCELQEVQCVRAPCPPIATCVPISRSDAGAEAPSCAAISCLVGTNCAEGPNGAECVPVASCAATLCAVGTSCVEGPNGAECVPVALCAAALCAVGTNCVEGPSGAECVPVSSCAATLCLRGSTCVETPKGAECVPESKCTAKCSAGQHCELKPVQCIRAPCPAQPSCVPDVDACATVRCKAGMHCELKEVQCFAAPCNPVAECIAS